MSSILDALQKVEKEKGRAQDPQDVDDLLEAIEGDDLVAAGLLGGGTRRARAPWALIAGAAALVLLGAGAAVAGLSWMGRENAVPSGAGDRVVVATGPDVSEASAAPDTTLSAEGSAVETPAPRAEPTADPASAPGGDPEPARSESPAPLEPVAVRPEPPGPAPEPAVARSDPPAPQPEPVAPEAVAPAPTPSPQAANPPTPQFVEHVQPAVPHSAPPAPTTAPPASVTPVTQVTPSPSPGPTPRSVTPEPAPSAPPARDAGASQERGHEARPLADASTLDRLTPTHRQRLGLPEIEVTYVGAVGPRSSALINYQIHYVGDYVADTNARVIDISRRGVAIEVGGERYFVPRRR